MNTILFTDDRIIYNDGGKGPICSLLIPKYSRIKKYADITAPNDNTVKLRHGDADDLPALWRQEGPYVYVYGNISLELDESRQTHHMYLPQDFVGPDVGAFYFVFGGRYVVHGVKTVTDDGHEVWGTSLINSPEEDVVNTVVSSLSERMLEGKEEKIIVAVHGEGDDLSQHSDALEPFEQEVVTFESLGKPSKDIRPLYCRKDKSFLMITLSICVFLALCWVIVLWVTTQIELQGLQNKTKDLKNAIRIMQKEKVLGHISNPKSILRVMDETIPLPPSTVLHGVGSVAAQLGQVQNIGISLQTDRRGRGGGALLPGGILNVQTILNFPEDSLLLDQERIAQTIVESTPWVKHIRKKGVTSIEVGVKVK